MIALLPLFLAGQAASGSTGAPVALRRDHPPLTRREAEAMTPAALGDALLAPGHPAILRFATRPNGMWPPLLPDSPIQLWVEMVTVPRPDPATGFCKALNLDAQTVRPDRVGDRADTLEQTPLYRLPDRNPQLPCGGVDATFFTPPVDEVARSLSVVRLIAAAQRRAHFPVTVDDREAIDMRRRIERETRGQKLSLGPVFTDPRRALAAVPFGATISVERADRFPSSLFNRAELGQHRAQGLEDWQLYAGGAWTVAVALSGDRIVAMKLRRAIPPPF